MKLFIALIFLIFFHNCSFDNKTGIWKNENSVSENDNNLFKDFETLITQKSSFDESIDIKKNFKFKLSDPVNNDNWNDIFYDETNNYKNFNFSGDNQLIFKSKKITKFTTNNFILFENDNLITSDIKGNIIIFSVSNDKVIKKFNFYKNKYKKIKKNLNIITNNGVIYVSDNIGFLYAYDYMDDKILWAKNFKTPFRSNLKLSKNKLILSNQNNDLFFINKKNGESMKLIPTEETTVKNQFKNNLSLNKNSIFFLNTYGSLYSINIETMNVNWFINLNQSFDLNPSNIFFGSKIITFDNKIFVSSNYFTYIIDVSSGSILYKINFSAKIKPSVIDNYLFLISKNNLLIAMNLKNGEIIYSYDINEKISEFLNIKKKNVKFKNIFIANNYIYIILKNSYILRFNIEGNLEKVEKLPTKIFSQPIFINGYMMYLSSSGKLSIVD
jgi:hypothetical protein